MAGKRKLGQVVDFILIPSQCFKPLWNSQHSPVLRSALPTSTQSYCPIRAQLTMAKGTLIQQHLADAHSLAP